MKAKTFENLIRKVVREEIDYALRREIKSLKEDLRDELKPTIVEHKERMVEVPNNPMSETAKKVATDAYVDLEDRVLDPSLLEKSVLERMPQPTGWRILVLPYGGKQKSKGGILLTSETVEREALATVVAYVVKMGPQCYNDTDKYGENPWCEEKQWGLIGRYAGARFKLEDGAEVRIINDDEVIATILSPDDIMSV